MKQTPIKFSLLLKVMKFNSVEFVSSPPAPRGCAYFVGSSLSESFFPYVSGPVHYLDRLYDPDEMLPVKLANSLAKHLRIPRAKFWADADALSYEPSQIEMKFGRRQV